jgi:hypothetical protein
MLNKIAQGIICLSLIIIIAMPAQAQWKKYTGSTAGKSRVVISDDSTMTADIVFPATSIGTSLDTTIIVTTAPTKLSGYLDTLNVSFLYLYNNTSGATLYVGGSAGVLTSGVPVSYQGSFTDNIGFYDNTTDIWLVATGSTDVRIKLKYR